MRTRRDSIGPTFSALFVAVCTLLLALVATGNVAAQEPDGPFAWPAETQSARPWTRWWWLGSAVELDEVTRLLKEYHNAGLGGVEITCIYGVEGNERRNREYLSDAWLNAVSHTATEARKLGMGVDLPAGSGWRMGGPSVLSDQSNSRLVLESDSIEGPQHVSKLDRRTTLQSAAAYNVDGQRVDLSDRIVDGQLEWDAPEGKWTLYTQGYRWAGDRVKRPGPGGEGRNINPFSKSAVSSFLTFFGEKLDQLPAGGIRAQFHDSFEYEGDWQPNFLDEFADRRGYRLEDYLRELSGDGDEEIVARVKCDYRETLADMVLENLVETWVDWAHAHDQLARNQSHGSPANWLDLYAACDIAETESFGRLTGRDAHTYMFKFASSAANVMGHPLVSSETATWLDEHFTVTLAQVKQIVDRQMLAGVNHVLYHGTAYSPSDATWPGWLFYASSQLNPQNPIWHDFPALNAYVTRSQSLLQAAKADNDVLLYWPIHDAWHDPRGMRKDIRVHNGRAWIYGWPLEEAADAMTAAGMSFDFVSDRLLQKCEADRDGRIRTPGSSYQAIVVPAAEHMPLATLEKLAELADAGVPVIFWKDLPRTAAGMAGASENPPWDAVIAKLRPDSDAAESSRLGDDLIAMLTDAGVRSEPWAAENKLSFLRKRIDGDTLYLIQNPGEETFDGPITLAIPRTSAVLMDALTGQIGRIDVSTADHGRAAIRLQLAPGQTLFVRLTERPADGVAAWPYRDPAGEAVPLAGPWHVDFVAGGPSLPEWFTSDTPKLWTDVDDPNAESFAGTARYTATLTEPLAKGRWLLDLGDVQGTARVWLGSKQLATLIAPPYQLEFDPSTVNSGRFEIEVTGVAANRIRDLDRREVRWRIFEDINVVNINYREFDASDWPIRPLGLAGPVTLTPLSAASESAQP